MSDDLKVGDVVTLRTGGHQMTIVSTNFFYRCDSVECAWSKDGDIEYQVIPLAAVVKAKQIRHVYTLKSEDKWAWFGDRHIVICNPDEIPFQINLETGDREEIMSSVDLVEPSEVVFKGEKQT
jgi:uncharacterized protein YodC (DUF2158 family)